MEIDANILAVQLNQSEKDLPGALVTQWIAWIQLFDFKFQYIPSQEHGAAEGLSRESSTVTDLAETEVEENIDDFIFAELNNLQVSLISLDEPTSILADNYWDNFRILRPTS